MLRITKFFFLILYYDFIPDLGYENFQKTQVTVQLQKNDVLSHSGIMD